MLSSYLVRGFGREHIALHFATEAPVITRGAEASVTEMILRDVAQSAQLTRTRRGDAWKVLESGADERDRTADLLITKQLGNDAYPIHPMRFRLSDWAFLGLDEPPF